jgi:CheY-like chemotaxis protein
MTRTVFESASPKGATKRAGGQRSGPRILLVESDPGQRGLLRESLKGYGFAVDTAEDGRAAEGLVLENKYTAYVIDIALSDGNGIDLIRRLDGNGNQPRVVLLTAFLDGRTTIPGDGFRGFWYDPKNRGP